MKKNSKGFVFVETLVIVAVLSIALVLIYRGFASAISAEKRRLNQDNPIYVYRTYYIKEFLMKSGLRDTITYMNEVNNTLILSISCDMDIYYDKLQMCDELLTSRDEDLKSSMDVSNIFLINNLGNNAHKLFDSGVDENTRFILRQLPAEGVDYLRTIINDMKDSSVYLVMEYKNNCRNLEKEPLSEDEINALKENGKYDEYEASINSGLRKCDYFYASVKVGEEY